MGGRCYILTVEDDGEITRLQGPSCTDNFQIINPGFMYLDYEWFSVEQAFQALKFPKESIARLDIHGTAPKIGESDEEYGLRVWLLGQQRGDSTMRDDWEQEKVKVMLLLNLAKYTSDLNLQNELIATDGFSIEAKDSTSNWKHWNECTQIWIRQILKSQKDLDATIRIVENMVAEDVEHMLDSAHSK
jgi:predicted NAD-dependent protein-ADP-ribosyltransferase YbiA (DUF1768 family)